MIGFFAGDTVVSGSWWRFPDTTLAQLAETRRHLVSGHTSNGEYSVGGPADTVIALIANKFGESMDIFFTEAEPLMSVQDWAIDATLLRPEDPKDLVFTPSSDPYAPSGPWLPDPDLGGETPADALSLAADGFAVRRSFDTMVFVEVDYGAIDGGAESADEWAEKV